VQMVLSRYWKKWTNQSLSSLKHPINNIKKFFMSLKPPVSQNDHIQGDIHSVIELVEYGDYQCPHCGQAYAIVKAV
jgi:hypothetical protein